MTTTKKALNLFYREFTTIQDHGDGPRRYLIGSAIHTCDGTMPLWGQLVRAGYVAPITPILGHPFAYEITEAGRKFIESQ